MSGLLMDERFVAVFPSLVRLLGSAESAIILQHLHWSADPETGDCKITRSQISDETGISFATVTRRLSQLRDGGWLTSRRASTSDSTQVYQVCMNRVREHDSRESQTATPGNRSLATSESRNLQLSSLQKEEVSIDTGSKAQREAPEQTPSRQITADWQPRPDFMGYLRETYSHVDVGAGLIRFINYHLSRQDTSKSWEGLFENWVMNDEERALRDLAEGTDSMGIPHAQRKTSVVQPARPGDPDYVNPDDLSV